MKYEKGIINRKVYNTNSGLLGEYWNDVCRTFTIYMLCIKLKKVVCYSGGALSKYGEVRSGAGYHSFRTRGNMNGKRNDYLM